ncbi:hypothetical protein ABK040_003093 [Willaertia magna]
MKSSLMFHGGGQYDEEYLLSELMKHREIKEFFNTFSQKNWMKILQYITIIGIRVVQQRNGVYTTLDKIKDMLDSNSFLGPINSSPQKAYQQHQQQRNEMIYQPNNNYDNIIQENESKSKPSSKWRTGNNDMKSRNNNNFNENNNNNNIPLFKPLIRREDEGFHIPLHNNVEVYQSPPREFSNQFSPQNNYYNNFGHHPLPQYPQVHFSPNNVVGQQQHFNPYYSPSNYPYHPPQQQSMLNQYNNPPLNYPSGVFNNDNIRNSMNQFELLPQSNPLNNNNLPTNNNPITPPRSESPKLKRDKTPPNQPTTVLPKQGLVVEEEQRTTPKATAWSTEIDFKPKRKESAKGNREISIPKQPKTPPKVRPPSQPKRFNLPYNTKGVESKIKSLVDLDKKTNIRNGNFPEPLIITSKEKEKQPRATWDTEEPLHINIHSDNNNNEKEDSINIYSAPKPKDFSPVNQVKSKDNQRNNNILVINPTENSGTSSTITTVCLEDLIHEALKKRRLKNLFKSENNDAVAIDRLVQ